MQLMCQKSIYKEIIDQSLMIPMGIGNVIID